MEKSPTALLQWMVITRMIAKALKKSGQNKCIRLLSKSDVITP